jgi:tetratricopeptide (TPR) repeat protein
MRVGAYELLEEIGRGGAGTVSKARSPDGRIVALKLLHRLASDGARARFAREQRLLAAFGEAEGFVPLLDTGDSEKGPFIVMPFLGGGTLRRRLGRPWSPGDAVRLGTALADALAAAHAKGVVHRDLKPENVLYTTEGRPLLSDLGLAKHFRLDVTGASESIQVSQGGEPRGTIGYMPAEQFRDAMSAGPPADVFALGAMLYECLAGRQPFGAKTPLEIVAQIELGEFDPLLGVQPRVPYWLAQVVERSIARKPEDRFANGFELGAALRAGGPSRPPSKHARTARTALFVFLAGALAVAGWSSLDRRARERADATERELAAADWVRSVRDRAEKGRLRFEKASRIWRAERGNPEAILFDVAAASRDAATVRVFLLKSELEAELDRFREAIDDAGRALELDPRSAAAHAARGWAQVLGGNAPAAVASVDSAIAIDSGNAFAFMVRAFAGARTGDVDRAIDDATRAIELDRALARAYAIRAFAHAVAVGLPPDAPTFTRVSLFLPPSSDEIREQLVAARVDGDHAALLDPRDPFVRFVRALVSLTDNATVAGLPARVPASLPADPDLDSAIESRPTFVDARLLRAWLMSPPSFVSAEMSIPARDETVRGEVEAILKAAPDHPRAWLARARFREAHRDFGGALEDLRHAVSLGPFLPAQEAIVQLAFQRPEAAIDAPTAYAAADDLVSLAPRRWQSWTWRAYLRKKFGEVALALSDADKAVELVGGGLEPADSAFRLRAELRSATKDFQGAADDWTRVLELEHARGLDRGLSLFERGRARKDAGELEGAREDFEGAANTKSASLLVRAELAALGPSPRRSYAIVSSVSGLCLTARGDEDGDLVQQEQLTPRGEWRFVASAKVPGAYCIFNAQNGLCLDVIGRNQVDGGPVGVAFRDEDQVWRLEQSDRLTGSYFIVSAVSGLDLDVQYARRDAISPVVQAAKDAKQVWRLMQISAPPKFVTPRSRSAQ